MSNDARVEGAPRIEGADVVFDVTVGATRLRVFTNAGGVFHTGGIPAGASFDAAVIAANTYATAHRAELEALYKQLEAMQPPPAPMPPRNR